MLLDKGHHTLACGSCGAPLRDLKQVPLAVPRKVGVSHRAAPKSFAKAKPQKWTAPRKPRKPKPRKGWFGSKIKDLFEDVIDAVEDVVDAVEDVFD